ncbi:MAG: hypothetical protein ABSD58_04445 [Verrucomicrobiia bacterium]|jgi:hypothetical protein
MNLGLTFAKGAITGEGNDDLGPFVIRGKYVGKSGECHWTKTYVGKHDVFYKGYREGRGIYGGWEIGTKHHGGFHIWPVGSFGGEQDAEPKPEEKPLTNAVRKPVALSSQTNSLSTDDDRVRSRGLPPNPNDRVINNGPSKPNSVDKRQLCWKVHQIAYQLIDTDEIEMAAEVLADYRKRFGRSGDGSLRFGLAVMFVLIQVRGCWSHQARRVGYIIDEHLDTCGSISNQHTLRQAELEMFNKSGDAESAKTVVRRLADMDDMDR